MPLDRDTRVGVLGAGAMGSGIAQVAAVAGHRVFLADSNATAVAKAVETIKQNLAREVAKGRLSGADAKAAESRIGFESAGSLDTGPVRGVGLVIEAIVEDLAVKRQAFARLEQVVARDCVLATNTSSLSVGAIAEGLKDPTRVIGLHFFNPANVLPLVEVIGAKRSAASIVAAARKLVDSWGKVTVRASDTPGFIVNRVARPFYGEALKLLEDDVADVATIDWAMKELGGFRMGPFELMDLIGNDVNFAVTKSVFEATGSDERYRTSPIQARMVAEGNLGRKSGRGYYDYGNGATPPAPKTDRALGAWIVDRVVAMLINEAADAVHNRIASRDDVDLAMTKGVNYPKGLLRWADEIGIPTVVERMTVLRQNDNKRYRPSPLLIEMAHEGQRFY